MPSKQVLPGAKTWIKGFKQGWINKQKDKIKALNERMRRWMNATGIVWLEKHPSKHALWNADKKLVQGYIYKVGLSKRLSKFEMMQANDIWKRYKIDE